MEDKCINPALNPVVHPDWIELCTKYRDLFSTSYSGYWMRGLCHRNDKWLARVTEFEVDNQEELDNKAIAEFKAGKTDFAFDKKTFEGYFVIDEEFAKKAYKAEALYKYNQYGWLWYEDGDAWNYDRAIQLALFDDVIFG